MRILLATNATSQIYFCNIQMKHSKHKSKTPETLEKYMQHLDLFLQHPDKIFETKAWNVTSLLASSWVMTMNFLHGSYTQLLHLGKHWLLRAHPRDWEWPNGNVSKTWPRCVALLCSQGERAMIMTRQGQQHVPAFCCCCLLGPWAAGRRPPSLSIHKSP